MSLTTHLPPGASGNYEIDSHASSSENDLG